MDITSLLLAFASLSASFVAILGGFIASRLIAINSERAACSSQLREVNGQLVYYRGVRTIIDTNRSEEDAIRYIYHHMAEMVEGKSLDVVYEEAELQSTDFVDMEPLWKRAQEVKAFFDSCLQDKTCLLNSDMIPVAVAEEYTDDLFAYEFCKLYAGWGFGNHDFENEPFRETGEWYDRDNQKAFEYTTQMMILEAREKQLTASLNALKKPTGMKAGLIVFTSFSFFNIIVPLILTLFSFSGKSAIVVAGISITLLTIGLVVTFFYLAWMLNMERNRI